MTATEPRAECQPVARQENGAYRPACLCGWSGRRTYTNRAEALAMARALHDAKENAA